MKRTRSINIKAKKLLEIIRESDFDIEYVDTNNQYADIFTKPLCERKINLFCKLMWNVTRPYIEV